LSAAAVAAAAALAAPTMALATDISCPVDTYSWRSARARTRVPGITRRLHCSHIHDCLVIISSHDAVSVQCRHVSTSLLHPMDCGLPCVPVSSAFSGANLLPGFACWPALCCTVVGRAAASRRPTPNEEYDVLLPPAAGALPRFDLVSLRKPARAAAVATAGAAGAGEAHNDVRGARKRLGVRSRLGHLPRYGGQLRESTVPLKAGLAPPVLRWCEVTWGLPRGGGGGG
jgi:hypothetical protein